MSLEELHEYINNVKAVYLEINKNKDIIFTMYDLLEDREYLFEEYLNSKRYQKVKCSQYVKDNQILDEFFNLGKFQDKNYDNKDVRDFLDKEMEMCLYVDKIMRKLMSDLNLDD